MAATYQRGSTLVDYLDAVILYNTTFEESILVVGLSLPEWEQLKACYHGNINDCNSTLTFDGDTAQYRGLSIHKDEHMKGVSTANQAHDFIMMVDERIRAAQGRPQEGTVTGRTAARTSARPPRPTTARQRDTWGVLEEPGERLRTMAEAARAVQLRNGLTMGDTATIPQVVGSGF